MTSDHQQNRPASLPDGDREPASTSDLVSRITSVVLLAVLFCVGWMVFAAYQPEGASFVSVDVEVGLIIGLLLAALMLVSVVALRQTRT
jgi:hypothetical protein